MRIFKRKKNSSNYNEEKEFLKRVEEIGNNQNIRRQLTKTETQVLKKKYPNIPEQYLNYLMEIGSGSFRECQFDVKPDLFNLEELGIDHFEIKPEIRFFGDNFSGDFSGFDLSKKNGKVVELWHADGTIYNTKMTFRDYIRSQMLIDENGNDKRVK